MEIKENRSSRFLIPVSILLLNIILKSLFLTNRDIALDEPFSIYYGQMDLASIVDMLYNENNPPLHFFILHFFIKLGGIGAFAVRLPSMLFSALTAVFVYKIGDKFFNKTVGIGAALVFSLSTMHIFFSHEARVYPLFVLLTAASLFYFLRITESPESRKNYIFLFICNSLLIYSHYFGFFVLFAEVISLLAISNVSRVWKKLFLVMFMTSLTYIPIVLIFFHRLGVSTGHGTWVSKPGVTELYGNLNRFLNNKYNTAVLLILILCALCLLFRSKDLKTKFRMLFKTTYFRIILIWFIVPYLIMFLVSFKVPMFIDRYILFTSIPFYIVIIVVLNFLYENAVYAKVAIGVLIISQVFTIQLNPDNNRRLKEVVAITKALKTSTTKTIIAPDYAFMSFCYHYSPEYFQKGHDAIKELNKDNIFAVSNSESAAKVLEDTQPCIYIQAGTEFSDPENLILIEIQKRYKNHRVFHVYEIYDIHYFTN